MIIKINDNNIVFRNKTSIEIEKMKNKEITLENIEISL